MKYLIAPALIALAACSTPEQIAATAKSHCDLMGYAANDPRYAECVERGFRGQKQAEEEAAAAGAALATTAIILNAMF